jgi:hypothetical protein
MRALPRAVDNVVAIAPREVVLRHPPNRINPGPPATRQALIVLKDIYAALPRRVPRCVSCLGWQLRAIKIIRTTGHCWNLTLHAYFMNIHMAKSSHSTPMVALCRQLRRCRALTSLNICHLPNHRNARPTFGHSEDRLLSRLCFPRHAVSLLSPFGISRGPDGSPVVYAGATIHIGYCPLRWIWHISRSSVTQS